MSIPKLVSGTNGQAQPATPEQEQMFDDYLFDDDHDAEDEEMWEAEMNCSMDRHGQCGQAGSEYCDFECPFRH